MANTAPTALALRKLEVVTDPCTLHAVEHAGNAVVARARVGGHSCLLYLTDPGRSGGALGAAGGSLVAEHITRAARERTPIVGIWHSGGASLHAGSLALDGMGRIFRAISRASSRTLQISVIDGPAAGGAAYAPALTDIVVMTEASYAFVTGPKVIARVTGEHLRSDELGGPAVHHGPSGFAHLRCADLAAATAHVARLLDVVAGTSTVPAGGSTRHVPVRRDPREIVPVNPRHPYDMVDLVDCLLDEPGLVLSPAWAPNMLTALGRIAGHSVGVLANNPMVAAGCIDTEASDKAARFVQFCDSFGLPMVVLVDVPGYLPGAEQEAGGILRRGAKLLRAFATTTVPSATVVIRKAYGGAYIAMNSRGLGAHLTLGWPGAEVGVMNAESAVSIIHRKRIEHTPAGLRDRRAHQLAEHYRRDQVCIDNAVDAGLIDRLVEPGRTRAELAAFLLDAGGRTAAPTLPISVP